MSVSVCPAVLRGGPEVLQLRFHRGFCHRGHSQTHRFWPASLFQGKVFRPSYECRINKSVHGEMELKLCVCVFVRYKMEPAGPRHRAVVHHGNHTGGNRPECLPPHQPHHHTHHASPSDNKRYTRSDAQTHTTKQTPRV